MNKVFLTGRLTRDVETRQTKSDMPLARTGIAVDRPTKEKAVDFFNLSAFGNTAKIMGKYCSKGTKILLEGHLCYSKYEDNQGNKKISVEVIVDNFEFFEPRGSASKKPDNDSGNAGETEPMGFDPNDMPF